MAKDELDLVCHLGDYIYEGGSNDGRPRRHRGGRLTTLDDYRIRHAQYKTDPHLQAMHARCPWLVTWDDHELSNNYANHIDGRRGVDVEEFMVRRAAAYQAYYEAMPLRARSLPKGPNLQLYRSASFGRLANFAVLDTRQYRSDQPNNDNPSPLNAATRDPRNSMLGSAQKAWLKRTLEQSSATWNVLAQQVMVAMLGRPRGDDSDELRYGMDTWNGYVHERMDLMRFLDERKIANPVVLTGDVHSNWVNELRVDDREPDRPIVATEFVGTSITSGGDGADQPPALNRLMAHNPGLRFHNRQRGYVRCTVTPQTWRSDYVTLDKVSTPGGVAQTRASFVVEAGQAGVKPA